MARRYGEPITALSHDGQPVAFTWRGVAYRVRVIGTWRLVIRWWETSAAVDRVYFRVQTEDQQVFEMYYETAQAAGGAESIPGEHWVLDVCLD